MATPDDPKVSNNLINYSLLGHILDVKTRPQSQLTPHTISVFLSVFSLPYLYYNHCQCLFYSVQFDVVGKMTQPSRNTPTEELIYCKTVPPEKTVTPLKSFTFEIKHDWKNMRQKVVLHKIPIWQTSMSTKTSIKMTMTTT